MVSNYNFHRQFTNINCRANIQKKSGKIKFYRLYAMLNSCFCIYLRLACAAANLAMGTRKGEQLT
jgi:hypothetical protein